MRKKLFLGVAIIIVITIFCIRFNSNTKNTRVQSKDEKLLPESHVTTLWNFVDIKDKITSRDNIILYDIDGSGKNYSFTYKNETYNAYYSNDNWHIVDSYKIKSIKGISMICNALIDVHPVHGRDMTSYRTVEDLVNEWIQHNVAYYLLSENDQKKQSAKDVDLNPEDQGKSFIEMYRERKDN